MARILCFVVDRSVTYNADMLRGFLSVARSTLSEASPAVVYVVGGRRLAGFVESVCRSLNLVCDVIYVVPREDDDVIFLLRESERVVFVFDGVSPSMLDRFLFLRRFHGGAGFVMYVLDMGGRWVGYDILLRDAESTHGP